MYLGWHNVWRLVPDPHKQFKSDLSGSRNSPAEALKELGDVFTVEV